MDIKKTFLDLTKHTVPYGKEDEYLEKLLPSYLRKDSSGNYYYIVGDSDVMFTAHLDTVGDDTKITHVIEDGLIKSDGKSILGADDKAGVVILFNMIEKKVPGFYFFPIGEEVGCIGSGKLSKILQDSSKKGKINILNKKTNKSKSIETSLPKDKKFNKIRKVISFDRMGYTSVITHQMDQRCCSNEFGKALADELNKHGFEYVLDDSGVYSDSAEFTDIYPECTNLSVGYFAQHTHNETQDIEFLETLADACAKIDWNKLPIYRDPNDVEFLDNYYNYMGGRGSGKKHGSSFDSRHQYIYDDQDADIPASFMKGSEKDVRVQYFNDEDNDYICDVSYIGNKMVDINLSDKRLSNEIDTIEEILNKFDVNYDDIFWDGLVLVIEAQKNETKMTRNELMKFIPELALDEIPGYDEREEEEIDENEIKNNPPPHPPPPIEKDLVQPEESNTHHQGSLQVDPDSTTPIKLQPRSIFSLADRFVRYPLADDFVNLIKKHKTKTKLLTFMKNNNNLKALKYLLDSNSLSYDHYEEILNTILDNFNLDNISGEFKTNIDNFVGVLKEKADFYQRYTKGETNKHKKK